MKLYKLLIAGLLGLSCAAQAQTSVNATIGGVIYPQPVIIAPVAVAPAPMYMHVPPGHAKKWRKHCHKYNACGTPVYFVQANYAGPHSYPVQPVYYDEHKGKGKKHKHKKDKHDDHVHGHGKHKD